VILNNKYVDCLVSMANSKLQPYNTYWVVSIVLSRWDFVRRELYNWCSLVYIS